MAWQHQPAALSRRRLVGLLGVGGLGFRVSRASASSEHKLRVGFISPRTGALAGFGQTDGHVLDLSRTALTNGFKVGETTYDVTILDRDTQSAPSRANQLAKALIADDQIDLMLAASTPKPSTLSPTL